jgi:hypothetical protein
MGVKNNFKYKIYCELIIVTNDIASDEISRIANLEPYRTYNKGDVFESKNSGTKGAKLHNLWAIKSETTYSEEENVSTHIQYFKTLIDNKAEILKKFKNDLKNETSFWIWIETNDAGVGLDILEDDLLFINNISNRLHFSIIVCKNTPLLTVDFNLCGSATPDTYRDRRF